MFLADENIPLKTVQFLRGLGYEVFDLREEGLHSISDTEILELARKRDLISITFDKHFTNIIKYPPNKYKGIIRIRIHPPIAEDIHKALKSFLTKISINELKGKLIILGKTGYRIRH